MGPAPALGPAVVLAAAAAALAAACFSADSVATRSVIFALFSARSSRVSSRVGSLRLSDDIVIMIDRVYGYR